MIAVRSVGRFLLRLSSALDDYSSERLLTLGDRLDLGVFLKRCVEHSSFIGIHRLEHYPLSGLFDLCGYARCKADKRLLALFAVILRIHENTRVILFALL